jgi:hypothetical protein
VAYERVKPTIIIIIIVIKASSRNAIRNTWQYQGCYNVLFHKHTVKRSAQCHVFARSPPDRRPNDKYPVNTSHRSDLSINVSLQCYLVATVILIPSVRSQTCVCVCVCVCVYTHVVHSIETLVGRQK